MPKSSVKKLEPDERIRLAAEWLLDQRAGGIIAELKERFGLNASQAVKAIRLASELRARS